MVGLKKSNIFNVASNARIEMDFSEPVCNRGKLDTGTHCNYECEFCYYIDQLNKTTSFEVIKERVDYLVKCGITEVDLSGGESSIHVDWYRILDYCKERGLIISTLSNGFKFADFEFMQNSKERGLEEILFSVHGYDRDSHNRIVGNKHGFDHIIQAISNAHILGIKVRINCTVTKDNYTELDTKFVALMRRLNPFEINFITLNYWNAQCEHDTVDYNTLTPPIHRAIDILKDIVDIINVRYTPFCFMKGYEKYIVGYYQHIYDVYDWNIAIYDERISPEVYRKDKMKELYAAAAYNRNSSYYKTKECMGCIHYHICDGVERQIPSIDLHPEDGDKIREVNYYRRGYYKGERC